MKIHFILGYLEDAPLEVASNWQDISSSKYVGPTRQQYQIYKLFEKNEPFWKELKKVRKRLSIPEEGFSWEVMRLVKSSAHTKTDKERKLVLNEYYNRFEDGWYTKKWNEQEKLKRKFRFHPYVLDILDDLIDSQYVATYPMESLGWDVRLSAEESEEIEIDPNYEIQLPESLIIWINERVSKHKLLRFIEDNWNEIDEMNQKLPNPNFFKLSDKEKRIYQLRNDGLTYSQITEEISKEFDPDYLDDSINQDNIKTTYHRVKAKIESIALRRNKKL